MMAAEQIDPIIVRLADHDWLANRTVSLLRYHRPVIAVFDLPATLEGDPETHYRPYDIFAATDRALEKNSIDSRFSMALVNSVSSLALKKIPNYEVIMKRRNEIAQQLSNVDPEE